MVQFFYSDSDKIESCPRQSFMIATSSTNSMVSIRFASPAYVALCLSFDCESFRKCLYNAGQFLQNDSTARDEEATPPGCQNFVDFTQLNIYFCSNNFQISLHFGGLRIDCINLAKKIFNWLRTTNSFDSIRYS